ncbi:MAG: SIS domain-containing protein [Patescibacteria group bacterium]|nr:SIS domain-containing protein [Patescibacteria group bacterium]
MINNLDEQKIYKKLDPNQVAKSIESLAWQMKQVWEEAASLEVPVSYGQATNVVVNGMGGSNIGVGLVKDVFSDQIKLPITITAGYEVPAMVGRQTLYLLSSYSGTTEEVLSVYEEVKSRGAKIMAICQQGDSKLAQLALKENLPAYFFKPEHNPCGQPRLGLGYSVLGVAILLAKAGLFSLSEKEIKKLITNLELSDQKLRPNVPVKNNQAKQMALKLVQKIPVIVGAEFLSGNLKIWRNQFNETSKNFSAFLELPDMNHYALEGLVNPTSNRDNLTFLFVDSKLYHPRVQKRAKLTKQVVKKNDIEYLEHELSGSSKLEQAFAMLQFGCWVTYYLAMLNNVNPVKIPWVDWFKEELGK